MGNSLPEKKYIFQQGVENSKAQCKNGFTIIKGVSNASRFGAGILKKSNF